MLTKAIAEIWAGAATFYPLLTQKHFAAATRLACFVSPLFLGLLPWILALSAYSRSRALRNRTIKKIARCRTLLGKKKFGTAATTTTAAIRKRR